MQSRCLCKISQELRAPVDVVSRQVCGFNRARVRLESFPFQRRSACTYIQGFRGGIVGTQYFVMSDYGAFDWLVNEVGCKLSVFLLEIEVFHGSVLQ